LQAQKRGEEWGKRKDVSYVERRQGRDVALGNDKATKKKTRLQKLRRQRRGDDSLGGGRKKD